MSYCHPRCGTERKKLSSWPVILFLLKGKDVCIFLRFAHSYYEKHSTKEKKRHFTIRSHFWDQWSFSKMKSNCHWIKQISRITEAWIRVTLNILSVVCVSVALWYHLCLLCKRLWVRVSLLTTILSMNSLNSVNITSFTVNFTCK